MGRVSLRLGRVSLWLTRGRSETDPPWTAGFQPASWCHAPASPGVSFRLGGQPLADPGSVGDRPSVDRRLSAGMVAPRARLPGGQLPPAEGQPLADPGSARGRPPGHHPSSVVHGPLPFAPASSGAL